MRAPASAFRGNNWHSTNCNSYIDAQERRNEPEDSLQGERIRAFRSLAAGHNPPTRRYWHLAGSLLASLLNVVD